MLCCGEAEKDTCDAVVDDPDDMPLSRENSSQLNASWNMLVDNMISDSNFLSLLFRDVSSEFQIGKLKVSCIG